MKCTKTIVSLLPVLFLTAGPAVAEEATVTERLAGAWSLVSLVAIQGDNRLDVFGEEPRGQMTFSPDGYFSTITTVASLPDFASNNRLQGTPEEYEAIGKGANALYGTYAVDEAAGTISFHVDVSTFPNWEGQVQVRLFTLDGDRLSYVNPSSTVQASSVEVVWRKLAAADQASADWASDPIGYAYNYGPY